MCDVECTEDANYIPLLWFADAVAQSRKVVLPCLKHLFALTTVTNLIPTHHSLCTKDVQELETAEKGT